MNPSDCIRLVIAKAAEAPKIFQDCSRGACLYWAASTLWNAEYESWKVLAGLYGIDNSAARCAWQRRTAYSEAAAVLLHAW